MLTPASNSLGVAIDVSALEPDSAGPRFACGGQRPRFNGTVAPSFCRVRFSPCSSACWKRRCRAIRSPPVSHVEGTTGREARDLIRELRDAFKAAGFTDAESKALIATVRNRGYRLGVPASKIVVDG